MSSPTVPAVTGATFGAEVVDADLPVLIDFWADWCPPCHMIAPVVAELAADHAGRMKVVAVDTDTNPDLGRRYQVMSLPTLILVTRGIERTRIVGAHPTPRILSAIRPYLDADPAAGTRAAAG